MTSTEDGSMVEREHKLYSQIVQCKGGNRFSMCANYESK